MDQRVLVTAGASGIGREIARAFAAQGARAFVCDIDATGLDKLAHEIPGLATTVCDMSKRGDIERMVPFGIDALGGLDVLVNNAGIAGPTARVEEMDPDEWEKDVQVNLNGTFNVTRRQGAGMQGTSKSQVSGLCKDLDAEVERFRSGPLQGPYRAVPLCDPGCHFPESAPARAHCLSGRGDRPWCQW